MEITKFELKFKKERAVLLSVWYQHWYHPDAWTDIPPHTNIIQFRQIESRYSGPFSRVYRKSSKTGHKQSSAGSSIRWICRGISRQGIHRSQK